MDANSILNGHKSQKKTIKQLLITEYTINITNAFASLLNGKDTDNGNA